jgi:hypothetical protein
MRFTLDRLHGPCFRFSLDKGTWRGRVHPQTPNRGFYAIHKPLETNSLDKFHPDSALRRLVIAVARRQNGATREIVHESMEDSE